jgi:hypothetical protein
MQFIKEALKTYLFCKQNNNQHVGPLVDPPVEIQHLDVRAVSKYRWTELRGADATVTA